jgi:multisubunit Na+/H+ antiporter MnhB subunit
MGAVLDPLLALALVAMSVIVIASRRIFDAIVAFVFFGLVVSLVWARLGAPDVALAEAAIGAGLTGALLLVAYRRLVTIGGEPEDRLASRPRVAVVEALLAGALAVAIGWVTVTATPVGDTAGGQVLAELPGTGLGNPVTGVLLVFRNLDTLLEMVVLLVALLGARAVRADVPPDDLVTIPRSTPVLNGMLLLVVPLSVVVAVHLLVVGADRPGGAFQGGAVLAAAGVLLVLSGRLLPAVETGRLTSLLAVTGVGVFILVGLGVTLVGRPFLDMPGKWAIYLVETAMMISIAVTLTLLFARSDHLRRGAP